MQVRTGGATAAAAQADRLAASHQVSLFDLEIGEVKVKTQQSLAVIDHYKSSLEI
jgi:hypothetical protein